MLATACGHSRALLEAGHALPVSVNVSPGDLLEQSFPDQVLRVMLDHHLPPQLLLLLEITVGSLIAEPERAARALNRRRGVRIALDDFSVGFSSLHHLRMLPIDELKLDRSLIFDVTTDQRSRSVVGGHHPARPRTAAPPRRRGRRGLRDDGRALRARLRRRAGPRHLAPARPGAVPQPARPAKSDSKSILVATSSWS